MIVYGRGGLLHKLASFRPTVHVWTISWPTSECKAGQPNEGYVGEWVLTNDIILLGGDIWMGNPYDTLWEGDVFVSTRNDINLWSPENPDEVLAHYQLDSHRASGTPHQRSFNLRPGVQLNAGQTLYVYRLFNNFDTHDTNAGDGWVMLYYQNR